VSNFKEGNPQSIIEVIVRNKGNAMANTISVLNEATGLYYTITVTVESTILSNSSTGIESYYMKVSTNAKDTEGRAVPDQILTVFGPTDNFTVAVQAAIDEVMNRVAGISPYVTSSSFSSSTKVSVSSSTSQSTMSSSTEVSVTSSSSTRNSSSSSTNSSTESSSSTVI
jgi:hypothetical protein